MTSYQTISSEKRASLALLAVVFILATALRVFYIGRELGGGDENAMLLYFGYSPLQMIVTNYWDANNHIFHTILVKLMGAWFGEDNQIAIRFPTLLFGLACLWMVYRVALELFNSSLTARMALLIAAVNPVHIHYSQTARGYGLIIFFSGAIALLSLRVLRSEISFGKGLLLTIFGFLSLYTLPTNIYFMFGLGAWVLATLFIPDPKTRFFKNTEERRVKAFFFLKVAAAVAALSFAAYAPLLDQLTDTIRNHQIMRVDTEWNSVPVLVPAVLEKVFPGGLMLFLPLLVFGLCLKNSADHSRWSLPLAVFFLPFVITLINGVGGYPRNYLYNFPLLIALLAAGMEKAGELCGRLFKNAKASRWLALGICAVCCVVSVNALFHEYYPSLKTSTGEEYSKSILKRAQPHDLIAVQSAKNYLYARKKVRENLVNILSDNRLSGFQLITPRDYDIFEFDPPPTKNIFAIIKRFWSPINFETFNLDEKNKITRMTGSVSKPLISGQTGESIQWEIFRGKGALSKIKTADTEGQTALKLESSPENQMIVRGAVPGVVSVPKPGMAVLVWTLKMKYDPKETVGLPNLVADFASPDGPQSVQVKMGKINDGMNIYVSHNRSLLSGSNWIVRSHIGMIPPGNYSFSLWLSCKKGQTSIYGKFRLFIIELADKKQSAPFPKF